MLAYLISGPAEEQGTLYFRDLTRPPSLKNIAAVPKVFNFVWADGHRTVYYTRLDELLRANKVYRHRLYASETTDELVYHEHKPTCFLDVSITKDKKYVTINSSSSSNSKVLVMTTEGSKPEQPRLVLPRVADTQYYVDHHEDAFYILHNHTSDNFGLSLLRDSVRGKVSWDKLQPVVTTSESEKLEELELFRNFALLYMKKGGLPALECHDFRTDERHTVPLDEPVASVYTGSNLKYDTSIVHFNTSSPLTMQSVYEYDMDKKILRKKGTRSPAGFDVRKYVVKRITVPSDTADIPVTLIHNKNLERNGQNPVNIRAYGAYGVPFEPCFRLEVLPLLRRGFIVALAHVRGGSDLGVRWYNEGRLLQKENSFKDLIAVADFMVREKYSHPNLLTGHGVSAGGLLMATAMNRRPDLFRAMVLRVPFLDPLSAMLDHTSPLTTVERGEWGDPLEDPVVYEYMAGYAPYDGIPFAYSGSTDFKTSVLITASLQDQRVALWQPLKYVARMRARNSTVYGPAAGLPGKGMVTSAATPKLLLKIHNDRGHNASGDEANLEDGALECAFLIREIEPFLENISPR
ncbi:hypothetical protein SpCBS45565_g05805 [Spizellomyces sp. 'palustris']|nr:hypothetical protein SpCBS45565_g05805 [Spizellomyces sp. 'palustris']